MKAIHVPGGSSMSLASILHFTIFCDFLWGAAPKQTTAWTLPPADSTLPQHKFQIIHSIKYTALGCLQCSGSAPAQTPTPRHSPRNRFHPQNDSAATKIAPSQIQTRKTNALTRTHLPPRPKVTRPKLRQRSNPPVSTKPSQTRLSLAHARHAL
jgi:hypothetical protein